MARFSKEYRTAIELDLDGGVLECLAQFDIEGEIFPREPTSYGHNLGNEASIEFELIAVTIGSLELSRSQVAEMGADVLQIEDCCREICLESFDLEKAA